jgi:phosphate transport system substrate-binding protein
VTDSGEQTSRAKWIWIILAVIVVISAGGIPAYLHLSRRTAASGPPRSTLKPALLCLAGSSTIGARVAPALAQEFLKQAGASEVKLVPGAVEGEQFVQGILPGASGISAIRIEGDGTAAAFDLLGNGSCDMVMATRRIRQEEITRLPLMGDMSSESCEHLVALDGIVVVVSAVNPIQSLSKEQLAAIFSGEISDWAQVGGPHGAINVYAPAEKSETYESFRVLVLGDTPLVRAAKRLGDEATIGEAVESDAAGIGFLSLAHMGKAQPISVSERGATALLPNRFNIATEDYPLSRRLYLYTPADPPNAYVRQFLQFAASKAGQDAVEAAGFVPQNLVAQQTVTTADNAPVEYQRLTRGAGRLSLDFRFVVGSSALDNKAMEDINRVVDFVGDLGYGGNNIILFGFSDSTGASRANLDLSTERAKAVAEELKKRGLSPGVVKGFGPYLPVAANDTNEGREKNRRVEIWLRR